MSVHARCGCDAVKAVRAGYICSRPLRSDPDVHEDARDRFDRRLPDCRDVVNGLESALNRCCTRNASQRTFGSWQVYRVPVVDVSTSWGEKRHDDAG